MLLDFGDSAKRCKQEKQQEWGRVALHYLKAWNRPLKEAHKGTNSGSQWYPCILSLSMGTCISDQGCHH